MIRVILLFILWASFVSPSRGQSVPVTAADTLKPGQNEHPVRAKFIPETDQRFFFFKNPSTGERARINVWGVRAGFLLPSNVKIGVGYYFTNQRADGQWDGLTIRTRRLSYGTAYVEPYYFRRKYWELSTPFEVGFGTARYELEKRQESQQEVRRVWAVPLGAGVSFSVKFPPILKFKPTRWFGVNFMTGYRLTLQGRVPSNPSTFNGLYYSISPTIFLDRFYEDFRAWRKRK